MTQDPHDEARQLLALGPSIPDGQQVWLRAHLQACEACRLYGEAAGDVVRVLRTLPLTADARLVRATQMRVRFHAARLREARQRMWLVGMACVGVGLSASVTAPILWRLFAWLGERAGTSPPVWQASFVCFYIVPALLVSVLLLVRGTYLNNDGERERQQR